VNVVTVDVVVPATKPVTGLTAADFTVEEEGTPQVVSMFKAIQLPAAPSEAPPRPRVSTNIALSQESARSFVIVFDDVHLTPYNTRPAKAAVAAFLESGVREGDRVSLLATSGEAWWSARMEAGRGDLIEIVKRLDGRNVPETRLDRMSDWEAMRIYQFQDELVGQRVWRRFETLGLGWESALSSNPRAEQMKADRDRMSEIYSPGVNRLMLESRAAEHYIPARSRSIATLAALERALDSLTSAEGRKTMVLVSDGFIRDTSVNEFKDVAEASRRANVAIYFLNTRGLQGLESLYSAQFDFPIAEQDMGAAMADLTQEAAGSEYLASDTGGFVIQNTNDLGGGIQRIARESMSYYLLGYLPSNTARDGSYRRIAVKVRGRGLDVRARKGYYAPRDGEKTSAGKADEADTDMQQALDSPYFSDQIPMRMTAYVREEASPGRARALLATEIDVSDLAFQPAQEGSGRVGTLHLLLVVAHRDSSEFLRDDNEVEIVLRPGMESQPGGAWYALSREFVLKPGWHQAKAVVRDPHGRKLGSITHEFEVPAPDGWRVSTPVLSDRLENADKGAPPAPAVLARRRFASGGVLFCQFDVYGTTKGTVTGMPQVSAGYELLRADGTPVRRGEPTAIRPTSLGYVSRLWAMGLAGVEPGEYELVITVKDEIADRVQTVREPFTITAAAAPAAGG
jgi:VWFA-related protein